jgi:nitroreductase
VLVVCGDTRGHERSGRVVRDWVAQGLVPAGDAGRVETSIRAAYEGSDRARSLMAVRNPAFAAMSLMLLATEQGIATAPVVAFSEEAVRRAFRIPDRYVPVVLVAMGMPSTTRPQPPRTPRLPGPEVVFHEDMGGAEP